MMDEEFPLVEIELNEISQGFVKIDGVKIPRTYAVEFQSAVGACTCVQISMYARVKVAGQCSKVIRDVTSIEDESRTYEEATCP